MNQPNMQGQGMASDIAQNISHMLESMGLGTQINIATQMPQGINITLNG
jgi:hypothetical protein